jgi:hypothetical protein
MPIVKSLGKYAGPARGFITYITEAGIRNPKNIIQIRLNDLANAKGDKAIKSAALRLAASTTAIVAAPQVIEEMSAEFFGINDEKKDSEGLTREQQIRQQSGFSKNDVLLFTGPDSAVSLSRVIPTALINNLFNAATNTSGNKKLTTVGKDVVSASAGTLLGGPATSSATGAIDAAIDARWADALDALGKSLPTWMRKKDPSLAIDPTKALPNVVADDEGMAKRLGFEASVAKTEEKYDFKQFYKNGGDREAAAKAIAEMGDNYDRLIETVAAQKKDRSTTELMEMLGKSIPDAKDRMSIIRGERPELPTPEKFILRQGISELRRRADILSLPRQDRVELDMDVIIKARRAKNTLAKISKINTDNEVGVDRAMIYVNRELEE